MNHSDIAALMKGVAPVIADLVAKSVGPLVDRITVLEGEIENLRSVDQAAAIASLVEAAVGSLPAPDKGADADPEITRQLVDEAVAAAVAALPPAEPGRPGQDVDVAEVERLVAAQVQKAVAALPPAEPGKSVTIEEVEPLIIEAVADAVSKIHPAQDGRSIELADVEPLLTELLAIAVADLPPAEPAKSVTIEDLAPMVSQAVSDAVANIPPPEPGRSVELADVEPLLAEMVGKAVASLPPAQPGPPGKLPVVKAWEDRVYYEGDCCSFEGATYQAQRDTGRAPTHDDWACIAAAGKNGADGRSLRVCGTFNAEGKYEALDLVALNGGAFVARKDDPGHCPGEGWQMVASRGKPGAPGEGRKGDPGKSIKGEPGEPVVSAEVSDDGVLTLINGDGSTVQCDLYPLLRKISGASVDV